MPDKTDKPSNQVLIKAIIQDIQEMKMDTTCIRNDLAYIKDKLKLMNDKKDATIEDPKGWFW